MKKVKAALALFAFFLINTGQQAQALVAEPMLAVPQEISFELFHGRECPHCHEEIKWLEKIQKQYPEIEPKMYEVWHNKENEALWYYRMQELGEKPSGVPTNIINGEVIVGFDKVAIANALGISLEEETTKPDTKETWLEKAKNWSWPFMSIALGLIDGFNPCAMWSLLVLISFLLTVESKKKRWLIGGIFLLTSGTIYGAALVAYLLGFEAIVSKLGTGTVSIVFQVVGVVAIVAGISSIITAPRAGIDCSVRDAKSKRKFSEKLQAALDKKSLWLIIPGVVGLAISVNAVELLCSFAIPTAFTATLISLDLSWASKAIALVLYDLMYMLDDLIVFTIAMWTLNLKVFSPKITQYAHAIGGIILLILGVMLLLNPELLATLGA